MPDKCHAPPVFGCSTCIEADKNEWAQRLFTSWLKTYRAPKCECGGWMKAYDYFVKDGKLVAAVACERFDAEEGFFPCADDEILVPIERAQ